MLIATPVYKHTKLDYLPVTKRSKLKFIIKNE